MHSAAKIVAQACIGGGLISGKGKTVMDLEEANRIVTNCRADDQDWTYEAVDLGNGKGYIEVYDEDGVKLGEM